MPFASSGAPIPSATVAGSEAQVTQTGSGIPKVGVSATATGNVGGIGGGGSATGLSAASGFASDAATTSGSSSGKKNGAVGGPKPFQWSFVAVGAVTILGMGVGGGLFARL